MRCRYSRYRLSACGRSLVPSEALIIPISRAGKTAACSASATENRRPSRTAVNTRTSTALVWASVALSDRASSASTIPRPARTKASNSCKNKTSEKLDLAPNPRSSRKRSILIVDSRKPMRATCWRASASSAASSISVLIDAPDPESPAPWAGATTRTAKRFTRRRALRRVADARCAPCQLVTSARSALPPGWPSLPREMMS